MMMGLVQIASRLILMMVLASMLGVDGPLRHGFDGRRASTGTEGGRDGPSGPGSGSGSGLMRAGSMRADWLGRLVRSLRGTVFSWRRAVLDRWVAERQANDRRSVILSRASLLIERVRSSRSRTLPCTACLPQPPPVV